MNITTEPIRDKNTIDAISIYLKSKNFRNYAIFKVQLNTALRISDVVKLKYDNCYFKSKPLKYIKIIEKKTKKSKKILVNKELNKILIELIENFKYKEGDYLFQSQKGQNEPISTTQVHRIYNNISKIFNLKNFNSHSLRKTFCYFAYNETKDIALLMQLLNHSSQNITLKYIGLNGEKIDELYSKIEI